MKTTMNTQNLNEINKKQVYQDNITAFQSVHRLSGTFKKWKLSVTLPSDKARILMGKEK